MKQITFEWPCPYCGCNHSMTRHEGFKKEGYVLLCPACYNDYDLSDAISADEEGIHIHEGHMSNSFGVYF